MKLFKRQPRHRRRSQFSRRPHLEQLEVRYVPSVIGSFQDGLWRIDANQSGAWEGTAGGDAEATFGDRKDVAVTGDWNGDGTVDYGTFHRKTGAWSLDANGNNQWDGSAGGDILATFGKKGTPVSGDWNGDGTDDIGVYFPGSGTWQLDANGNLQWDGAQGGDLEFSFGRGGVPVAGDWNGDGTDEVGIYSPNKGLWQVDTNGNRQWDGAATDDEYKLSGKGGDPVVGDWDGDGRDGIGRFRNGQFEILLDPNAPNGTPGAEVIPLDYRGASKKAAPVIVGTSAAGIELFLSAVQDGNWSDPATWGGTVPTAGHAVMIDADHVVTYDLPFNTSALSEVKSIDIRDGGVLRFSRTQSTRLDMSGSLSVMEEGTLDVGTAADPISNVNAWIGFNVLDDRQFSSNNPTDPHFRPGPDPLMPDYHPEDTGLWVMGMDSTASFQGAPKNFTWSKIATDAAAGATQVNLDAAPTGWRVGDRVLLTPTGTDPDEVEIRTIASISGNSITLTQPLSFLHLGRLYARDPITGNLRQISSPSELVSGETLVRMQGEVGLLTQNVTVASNLVQPGDVNHRAHAAFMMDARVSIADSEFRDLGPRGKLGRYPIHFHKPGSTSAGNTVSETSVWNSANDAGSRCIVVHLGDGVTVDGNVCYDAQGAGLYFEVAQEQGNTLSNNLVVRVHQPEELPNQTLFQMFGYPQVLGTGIWARMGNTVINNVVVGGVDASGMAITPLNISGSPSGPTIVDGNELRTNRAGVEFFGNALSANFLNGIIAMNQEGITASPATALGITNTIFIDNLDQPASDSEYAAREPDVFFLSNKYVVLP
jgi:hypothetical protein